MLRTALTHRSPRRGTQEGSLSAFQMGSKPRSDTSWMSGFNDISAQQAGPAANQAMLRGDAGPSWSIARSPILTPLRGNSAPAADTYVPPIVREVLNSPGRPLDNPTRAFFERRFGHDFSRVRVHTDALAAESARAVSARAYAVGSQLVFGEGTFSPGTTSGKGLLAHELVHVVQQSAGGGHSPAVATKLSVGPPDTQMEREAGRFAGALTNGAFTGDLESRERFTYAAPVIQRQEAPPVTKNEARLRGLARFPGRALQAWPGLAQPDRGFVLAAMTGNYGADFALRFTDFATGKSKPDFSIEVVQDDPKALRARGFQYAGDPGGVPVWVLPSGHEAHVLSPPSGRPPERDPEEVERCNKMCDDVDNDACNACCEERIPETDVRCRKTCQQRCNDRFE